MKDRIKQILLDEGLTSGAFADEIGVQRSSISHILNGRNNPSLDFVIKVVTHFYNIRLEWLLLGEGDMYKSEDDISEQRKVTAPTIFSEIIEDIPKKEPTLSIENNENKVVNSNNLTSQVDKIVIFYDDSSFTIHKLKK